MSNTSGFRNAAVGWGALLSNTTGSYNSAFGSLALGNISGGSGNVGIGEQALSNILTGSFNTAIGYRADVESRFGLTNATAVGYTARVDASNKVRIGNTAVTVIGGQVAWTAFSDKRAKKDIQDLDLGLDFINALRPVAYRMKDGNDAIDMGFIAQDIEELLGDGYNVLAIGGDAERTLSLRHTDLIAPMVKAMQEQQQAIQRQEQVIDSLRRELNQLRALIVDRR